MHSIHLCLCLCLCFFFFLVVVVVAVEEIYPGVASCVDILAIASRDAIFIVS
jgi:hypothetical protein